MIRDALDFQALLNTIALLAFVGLCIYYSVKFKTNDTRWLKITNAISVLPIIIVQLVFLLHIDVESHYYVTLMLSSITAIVLNKIISLIVEINKLRRGGNIGNK